MSGITGFVVIGLLLTGFVVSQDDLSQAGQHIGAAFQSLGKWIVSKYNKIGDFFSSSFDDLKSKVTDVAGFLNDAKNNMGELMKEAKAKGDKNLEEALGRVDGFYNDVNNFKNKVGQSAATNYQQLETEWQTKVQSMYNGGLDKIIGAAQAGKTDGNSNNNNSGNNNSGNGNGSDSITISAFLLSSALLTFVIKSLLQ